MTEPFVAPGDYRPRDACGRLIPRNPFRDPVVLFRAVPGLAEAFRGVVPPEHAPAVSDRFSRLSGACVDCVCGTRTPIIPLGGLLACPGDCGRYFVHTASAVRVARPG